VGCGIESLKPCVLNAGSSPIQDLHCCWENEAFTVSHLDERRLRVCRSASDNAHKTSRSPPEKFASIGTESQSPNSGHRKAHEGRGRAPKTVVAILAVQAFISDAIRFVTGSRSRGR
jgi:hypothetical protein